jgi:hypothetical protein
MPDAGCLAWHEAGAATRQIGGQFYSIVTNPRRVRVGSSSAEALRIIWAMPSLPGLFVLPTPARAIAGGRSFCSGTP